MADTVRYLMEEMIPELEDFERKGYFSRQEVKAIVKRRQDFEYLLKRRAALKQDFLRAIDYETKLEQLRRHRKRSLSIRGEALCAARGSAATAGRAAAAAAARRWRRAPEPETRWAGAGRSMWRLFRWNM